MAFIVLANAKMSEIGLKLYTLLKSLFYFGMGTILFFPHSDGKSHLATLVF